MLPLSFPKIKFDFSYGVALYWLSLLLRQIDFFHVLVVSVYLNDDGNMVQGIFCTRIIDLGLRTDDDVGNGYNMRLVGDRNGTPFPK